MFENSKKVAALLKTLLNLRNVYKGANKEDFDELDNNYDSLSALSENGIEDAIKEAFELIETGENVPSSGQEKNYYNQLKTELDEWNAFEAGHFLMHSVTKEQLPILLAAYPKLITRKIEEAEEVYSDVHPVYLRFARRWRARNA